jgi:hypothetical protein
VAQHYMLDGRGTESVCGFDMVGRRNPVMDMNELLTTCISCKAIRENRPLYAVTATDEDGYTETIKFNTPKEQLDYIETCFDNGAVMVTLQILSVDELKSGE